MSGWVWALIGVCGAFALGAAFFGVAAQILVRNMFSRRPKKFLARSEAARKSATDQRAIYREEARAWMATQPFVRVKLKRPDGVTLVARYLPPARPDGRTALLLHGYGSTHRSMAGIARIYARRWGYGVLLPDARGDGESGGAYQCMLDKSAQDMCAWCEWINRQAGARVVLLHGMSMGASTVAMASCLDLPNSVACIVLDCGPAEWENMLGYQLRKLFHLPPRPVLWFARRIYRRKTGCDIAAMRPAESAAASELPFLIIHGEADSFVPPFMAERFARAVGARGEVWLLPGAEHTMCSVIAPQAYEQTLEAFLRRCLG